ncbi:MAG: DNA polymerase IV [Culicoidibacterales bacterium]
MSRIIFHVDMNSFFAACELAHHPEYRGKPLVVSGNSRRGVITTASYEARALGIHAAMPLSEARRIYPQLIVLPVNHERYQQYSRAMMEILQRFSPKVEQASIDEAYLDMSHLMLTGESYIASARTIQHTIQAELGLGSSIGISYNRFLAKMASDMQKPNGLTILRRADVAVKIWPLAIEAMYGVGPKTAEKLQALGIRTIGDLAEYTDQQALKKLIGDKQATWLHQRAKGNGNYTIMTATKEELDSIGHSRTFASDTIEERELEKQLQKLSELVIKRLIQQQVMAKTVQVTIRNQHFETITRSLTAPSYYKTEEEIFLAALNVFWEHWDGTPVRLLGVTLQNLLPKQYVYEQLRLF